MSHPVLLWLFVVGCVLPCLFESPFVLLWFIVSLGFPVFCYGLLCVIVACHALVWSRVVSCVLVWLVVVSGGIVWCAVSPCVVLCFHVSRCGLLCCLVCLMFLLWPL